MLVRTLIVVPSQVYSEEKPTLALGDRSVPVVSIVRFSDRQIYGGPVPSNLSLLVVILTDNPGDQWRPMSTSGYRATGAWLHTGQGFLRLPGVF